jgi:hypothetical protein
MLTPWDPAKHLGMVQGWAQARGVTLDALELPANGLVSEAAAGWLFLTDSAVGLLESFVTNPDVPARDRHRDVDAIGLALIEQSRGLGVKRLITMTTHRSIGRMMVRRGFSYSGPMHVLGMGV